MASAKQIEFFMFCATNFLIKVSKIFGNLLGHFEKQRNLSNNFLAVFISTSGHTGYDVSHWLQRILKIGQPWPLSRFIFKDFKMITNLDNQGVRRARRSQLLALEISYFNIRSFKLFNLGTYFSLKICNLFSINQINIRLFR